MFSIFITKIEIFLMIISTVFARRYLIEIAKIYNIEYEPDPQVMREDNRPIGMTINLLLKTFFDC